MAFKKDGLWAVAKGDTLTEISDASGVSVSQLCAMNNIENKNLIYVGQNIATKNDTMMESSTAVSKAPAADKEVWITAFGEISNKENELFATWNINDESNVKAYAVEWTYSTGNKDSNGNTIWFSAKAQEISLDKNNPKLSRQDTQSIPDNALVVRFRVKPVAEEGTDSKKTPKFIGSFTGYKTHNVKETVGALKSAPTVTLKKQLLTASLENIDVDATHIEFQIYKNDVTNLVTSKPMIKITGTKTASWSYTVPFGASYKVRCRAYKDDVYGEWSNFSSEVKTAPVAPGGFTACKATSETSVYLEWKAVDMADKYEIEYTTNKNYFDGTNEVTPISDITTTHWEELGLESGDEYFFRIRAINDKGEESLWSPIESVVIGEKPSPPTTWSSTTTAITGEPVTLYWVHNSRDNSSQTYANLEIYVNGTRIEPLKPIKNTENEDEKDNTSYYILDTSPYTEGTKIEWQVSTAGVLTTEFSEPSTRRIIDVYAKPTLELSVTNSEGDPFSTLTSFPFEVYALAGPNTQIPTGYQITITSDQKYETTDQIGNLKIVLAGDEVFSKYYDTIDALRESFTPSNVDLVNGMSYTLTCTVSMNSGLTASSSHMFTVEWSEVSFQPNASITVDTSTYTALIKPYCNDAKKIMYKVELSANGYVVTNDSLDYTYGDVISGVRTTTGEIVYEGVDSDGNEILFSPVIVRSSLDNTTLSVYRREYDGTFVELASGLENSKEICVTDPHPALDYARYRIVATNTETGAIGYYDPPGVPVNGDSVIMQWDDDWTTFEMTSDDPLEQPPWAGSLLKIPYDIDTSDKYDKDASLVKYVGRKHPVSYYGTQLGVSSNWKVNIPKDDVETLYTLRRLAIWQGDVYVREPSGSGYWAKVVPSWSQTHCELTIPVTFEVTRVEGGA